MLCPSGLKWRSYIGGGQCVVNEDDGPMFTTLVPVLDYVFCSNKRNSGDFLACWSACKLRFELLSKSEADIPNYIFFDQFKRPGNPIPLKYESSLAHLDWLIKLLPQIMEIERYMLETGKEAKVAFDLVEGNHFFASLVFLTFAANCRLEGIKHKMGNFDFETQQNKREKIGNTTIKKEDESEGLSDEDIRIIEAASNMGDGYLKVSEAMEALNQFEGHEIITGKEILPDDGFQVNHRSYLKRFREILSPYSEDVPAINERFLNPSDFMLGVNISTLVTETMRCSFPDLFSAERNIEHLKAQEARKKREEAKTQKKKPSGG